MNQGTSNVSHGCVNLHHCCAAEDAYYGMSIYGDPITVASSTAAGLSG